MTSFTPGPWTTEIDEIVPYRGLVYVSGPNGWDRDSIAAVVHSREGVERDEANAALIAASPDGYELALQYRNDMLHPNLDEGQRQRRIEAIDAYLKKVRGE